MQAEEFKPTSQSKDKWVKPEDLIENKEKLHFVVHVVFTKIKCNDDSLLCNNSSNNNNKEKLIIEHSCIVGVEDFRLKFSKEKKPKHNTVISNKILLFQTKIQGL